MNEQTIRRLAVRGSARVCVVLTVFFLSTAHLVPQVAAQATSSGPGKKEWGPAMKQVHSKFKGDAALPQRDEP